MPKGSCAGCRSGGRLSRRPEGAGSLYGRRFRALSLPRRGHPVQAAAAVERRTIPRWGHLGDRLGRCDPGRRDRMGGSSSGTVGREEDVGESVGGRVMLGHRVRHAPVGELDHRGARVAVPVGTGVQLDGLAKVWPRSPLRWRTASRVRPGEGERSQSLAGPRSVFPAGRARWVATHGASWPARADTSRSGTG
jgi:hypothetical protein